MIIFLQLIVSFGILFLGAGYIWRNHYEIVEVFGTSMYPTLLPGKLLLLKKSGWKLKEGSIYCYTLPDGNTAIKRLISYRKAYKSFECWFEGDNKKDSIDSRVYGYVPSRDIEGIILWRSR